jgi:hypothetical protein
MDSINGKSKQEQARILQQMLDKHSEEFHKRIEKCEVTRKIFQGGFFMASDLNPNHPNYVKPKK